MAERNDPRTPTERSIAGQIAANALWANCEDRTAATAAARAAGPGQLLYWERKIDPDGVLDPSERIKRAENAKREHYARLRLKSLAARRAKAGAGT